MKSKSSIPTREQNPEGLHQRYRVFKIVPGASTLQPIDHGAEYFPLRLDSGGKDPDHIKACRIAIHAYAKAIAHKFPLLAKELKSRYPLLK
jgi:hypothetical protein